MEEEWSIFIHYKGHFTLVHETWKSPYPPHRLIHKGKNSYSEFGSYGTSLEEEWSIFIYYKGHFTLVHETCKSPSPPHRLMDKGKNSYSEYGSYVT
jgi:hypothetical protein